MANHPLAPNPEGRNVLIYRFNPCEDYWEYWAYDEDMWFESGYLGGNDLPPRVAEAIVSFEDTWCEPRYEPEYD